MIIESHIPVLLHECIENLNIRPDGIYLDGTLGRGGHSYEIASRLSSGHLICVDKDESALIQGAERLSAFSDKVLFVHEDFRNSAKIIANAGFGPADGMLFDLGVSSPQLDDASRGFSYMQDSPLDMRMDRRQSMTARDIVVTCLVKISPQSVLRMLSIMALSSGFRNLAMPSAGRIIHTQRPTTILQQ